MKLLRRELCRMIAGTMGLVPPPHFGKVGLSTDDFRVEKTVALEFEDELGRTRTEKFGLWCGQIAVAGMRIRALATDLCDNNAEYHEFVVAYRVDGAPMHGLKVIYGEDHYGLFIVKGDALSGNGMVERDIWKPVGRYEMLIAAAGFEKISSQGLVWNPCNEYDDLYEILIEVVGMG